MFKGSRPDHSVVADRSAFTVPGFRRVWRKDLVETVRLRYGREALLPIGIAAGTAFFVRRCMDIISSCLVDRDPIARSWQVKRSPRLSSVGTPLYSANPGPGDPTMTLSIQFPFARLCIDDVI